MIVKFNMVTHKQLELLMAFLRGVENVLIASKVIDAHSDKPQQNLGENWQFYGDNQYVSAVRVAALVSISFKPKGRDLQLGADEPEGHFSVSISIPETLRMRILHAENNPFLFYVVDSKFLLRVNEICRDQSPSS